MEFSLKYIYGPVYSWRIGWSLGIDPISQHDKICNFDCRYCQLGDTFHIQNTRQSFIPSDEIIKEITQLPELKIDYFTISGRGEPTLASNFGEIIKKLHLLNKAPVAVITNGGLIDRPDVRTDLILADLVLLKLDAGKEQCFLDINRPHNEIKFNDILDGMHEFRREYHGKLALQIMVQNYNLEQASKIADIARSIKPDEIQLNTPLRPCSVNPISEKNMQLLKKSFSDMNCRTVYESPKEEYKPLSDHETALRHGKYLESKQ